MVLHASTRRVILSIASDLGDTRDKDQLTPLVVEALAVLNTLTENGEITRDDGLRIVMALCGYDDDPNLVKDILNSI
ncbi:hypothetical protein [Stackebrandtia soli]|uniref:hypothetical protein n=1 Tax=Stackebrandtia soli TaxID=1892856 RepID=UPI0039E92FE2